MCNISYKFKITRLSGKVAPMVTCAQNFILPRTCRTRLYPTLLPNNPIRILSRALGQSRLCSRREPVVPKFTIYTNQKSYVPLLLPFGRFGHLLSWFLICFLWSLHWPWVSSTRLSWSCRYFDIRDKAMSSAKSRWSSIVYQFSYPLVWSVGCE